MSVYQFVYPCLTRRVGPPRSMCVYPCLMRLMRSPCCPPPPLSESQEIALLTLFSPPADARKETACVSVPPTNSFVSYAVRVVSNAELFVVFVIFMLRP
jgi:hypothetical protein